MTASPLIWINGQRAAPDAAHLSALDRGFLLADGLFETMRISNGAIFRPGAHLGRLRASALRLGLPLPDGLPRLIEDATREAAADGVREAGLRLTVSRGIAPPGLAPPPTATPTCVVLIVARPGVPDDPAAGLSACIATGRRNEHAMSAGMKTLSYTDSVLALAEARATGADEALMLDTAGHLSEATASNLFLVARGLLLTPPLSCGALPGITRATVMEIADASGLEVEERTLLPDDLYQADEAFLTSSLRGIMPLAVVEGRRIGTGARPVTIHVLEQRAALIEKECAVWTSAAE